MGRKPKLSDKEFSKLVSELEDVNKLYNNYLSTLEYIKILKDQSSGARHLVVKKKKQLAVAYRVSLSYIDLLLSHLNRKARIYRNADD